MAIKIKLVNGAVPDSCMKLLIDFAGHCDVCDTCIKAKREATVLYCITGRMILKDLCDQPEVSRVDDE